MIRRLVLFALGIAAAGALLNIVTDEGGPILFGVALVGAGIILFMSMRARRRAVAADFSGPFVPHAEVELSLRRQPHVARIEDAYRGIFVSGQQGFTVRFTLPEGAALEPGTPRRVEVQFLKPELAAAHLAAGAEFSMLHGKHLVADGRVAKWGP